MTTTLVTGSPTKNWQELVTRGRRLVHSETTAQFALGDLALEMVPVPPNGKRPLAKDYKLLANYADEIGLEAERFEEYRRVAAAWPKAKRAKKVCWTVHAVFSSRSDRFELINNPPVYRRTGERMWTCDAANRELGRKPRVAETSSEKVRQVQSIIEEDDEVAAEVVQRAMSRRSVVSKVADNPEVRETFNRAQTARISRAREETRKRPEVRRLDENREVLTVLGLCSAFAHGIGKTLPGLHLAELSEDAKESIREGLERVNAAVEWTEHVLQTGSTDMDAALQKLLSEG
ncbi:DUF6192 family protein [Streptomyces tricolor]|uniref:DUF6192 family protein n=1 Tax=Streptomyces tricolor TaxID=68277 RepID=A0ABS9JK80_9ACTN|nr:DUF6192 family protein [Streptomyces tricolor]MCG0065979.1 DUF6192 family protein [Streptomyces tricolor]